MQLKVVIIPEYGVTLTFGKFFLGFDFLSIGFQFWFCRVFLSLRHSKRRKLGLEGVSVGKRC